MTDSQFLWLSNILNALELEYEFTKYRDFRIKTPVEEAYNLVDALMFYVNVGEWYSNENQTYIEIPQYELPGT